MEQYLRTQVDKYLKETPNARPFVDHWMKSTEQNTIGKLRFVLYMRNLMKDKKPKKGFISHYQNALGQGKQRKCNFCGKCFSNRNSVGNCRHTSRHTPVFVSIKKNEKYYCVSCLRQVDQNNLMSHAKSHSQADQRLFGFLFVPTLVDKI